MRVLKTRALSCLITAALLLAMLSGMASAVGNTIYTKMGHQGASDGSASKPYASFEDAVKNANDGDTIVIQGKAFANAREESGVSPLVIDKSVTITGEDGKTGELHVRAGGIILGADVTMTNVELNLANKYHNAIFVNGYHFTANNVTRGSISREVHLFAGGIGNGTQVITTALPTGGSHAALSLTNSTFGSIYAGGVMTGYTGDVTVTARGCRLGGVYGSGAQERAPDGNWFDTSEPPAPVANKQYAATGSVSIQTDADSILTVDAMDSRQVSVAVNNALGSRVLRLAGVKTLTVNDGTATVAELDTAANVTVNNAALELSQMTAPTLGSLSGSGKLILEKTQTLRITGDFDGTWAFETSGGFQDMSGVAMSGVAAYSHTYITAGGGNADVRFTPHTTQSSMTLDKGTNGWTTSAAPEFPEVVTSFEIDGVRSKTLSVEEIGGDDSYIPVKWTSPVADPDPASLAAIPFRYEVTVNGIKHNGTSQRDPEDGSYSALIRLEGGDVIWLGGSDGEPMMGLVDSVLISGNLSAGVYQIAIFAPVADGTELRQDFTLIVTDGTAAGITITATADTITVSGGSAASARVIAAQYVGGRMTDVCVIPNVALPAGGSYPLTLPVRSGATRTAFVLRADGTPLCAKQTLFSPAP